MFKNKHVNNRSNFTAKGQMTAGDKDEIESICVGNASHKHPQNILYMTEKSAVRAAYSERQTAVIIIRHVREAHTWRLKSPFYSGCPPHRQFFSSLLCALA